MNDLAEGRFGRGGGFRNVANHGRMAGRPLVSGDMPKGSSGAAHACPEGARQGRDRGHRGESRPAPTRGKAGDPERWSAARGGVARRREQYLAAVTQWEKACGEERDWIGVYLAPNGAEGRGPRAAPAGLPPIVQNAGVVIVAVAVVDEESED